MFELSSVSTQESVEFEPENSSGSQSLHKIVFSKLYFHSTIIKSAFSYKAKHCYYAEILLGQYVYFIVYTATNFDNP